MDLAARFQSILDNAIWLVIVAVGGLAMGYLRTKSQKWAAVILYGLAGSALVFGIIFFYEALTILTPTVEHATRENVESQVRKWVDAEGFLVQRDRDDPSDPFFNFNIKNPISEISLNIIRSRDAEREIVVVTQVSLPDSELDVLRKATPREMMYIEDRVTMEIAKLRIPRLNFDGGIIDSINVQKHVLIDNTLTRDNFLDSLDDVHLAAVLAISTYRQGIASLPQR